MSTDDAPAQETSTDPRRSRRRLIHGVLVAIDAPNIAEQPWVVDAIDLNANGMGLVLPPEIPESTHVFLSFKLNETLEFSRMPAIVRHQLGLSGGVSFEPWPETERLKLLEYLVAAYEEDV